MRSALLIDTERLQVELPSIWQSRCEWYRWVDIDRCWDRSCQPKPTYLLIGDLAFFHDMNGLQLLKQYQLPVTIILLNNNGGGDFFLLIAKIPCQKVTLCRHLAPPLDLDFQQAAKLYGGNGTLQQL